MKTTIVILFIMISILSCKKSQDFSKIDNELENETLENYRIYCIAFDLTGSAWLGTLEQGLIKFNDDEIIVYNSSNSIIQENSNIIDIKSDTKGNVWIGTGKQGLIEYNGTSFIQYNTENSDIPENCISSISIDSQDNIWFTSNKNNFYNLVKYNGSDFTIYNTENSDLPNKSITSIAISNNDDVWLSFSGNQNNTYLAKISGSNWTFFSSEDLEFTPYYISKIIVNNKNEVYGTNDYSASSFAEYPSPQVFIFDGKSCQKIMYNETSAVHNIAFDKDENLWCLSYQEIFILKENDWYVDNTTFENSWINVVELSNDSKMWVGTQNGIYIQD